jgi:hypothetical protein
MSGDDITKAAVEAREWAYQYGVTYAVRHILPTFATTEPMDAEDPYLAYQFYLGLAQAIANHGRDISGINFGKGNDPQRKGGKA